MHTDWQTYAAGAVVALTLLVFLIRLARPRHRGGCGHGCGCGRKPEDRKKFFKKTEI